jgi:F-type H+-transporting ATPase subunit delta
MRGTSRASLAEARDRLVDLVTRRDAGAAGQALHRVTDAVTGREASQASAVGDELFAVTDLLDRDGPLRRALSDPSRPSQVKVAVVDALLRGRISDATVDVVTTLVTGHWSAPADLPDAAEELAVQALALAADSAGQLDDLEDELFRFGRLLAAYPQLRIALTNPRLPVERRLELVNALLDGKVTGPALRLVRQAVGHPRGRSLDGTLQEYARIAAAERERLIAEVRVAAPLSAGQQARLAAALAAQYGRRVHLNVLVDPGVVGGVLIKVGDDVIDGSIASRLGELRRRLAS